MILLTLIKKEITQFFRKKSDVITMLIFPLVLILVMGSALDGIMSKNSNLFEDKIVYFNTNYLESDNKNIKIFYDFIRDFNENINIEFKHVEVSDEGKEFVDNNQGICFIDIYTDDYYYYRNKKNESSESKIFRNVFEQYLKRYLLLTSIKNNNPKDIQLIMSKEMKIFLKEEGVGAQEVNSYTYYTFTVLTLIMLYISGITCTSMYGEKNLNTLTRLKVSKANEIQIILGKVILGVVIGIFQIAVVYIVSKFFFKVSWGSNMTEIILVLISLAIFSSVLGIFMSMICTDEKTAYSINSILLVFMGFLGGSYVPITLVKSTQTASILCKLVPNYWANISLISISYNVDNYYSAISIILSLVVSLFLLVLGRMISKLKVGGRID